MTTPPAAYYQRGQRVAIVATADDPSCYQPGTVRTVEWRDHDGWWYGVRLDADDDAAAIAYQPGWHHYDRLSLRWAQGWQLSRIAGS